MAQSSKKSSAPAAGRGNIRAAIGVVAMGWGLAAFFHGPALALRLHAFGVEAGPAVFLAFGLELAAVLAGMALIEPLIARLQAWRD